MDDRGAPHSTVEKQGRPSPRRASSENSSFPSDPISGQEGCTTPTRGDRDTATRLHDSSYIASARADLEDAGAAASAIASSRTPLHIRSGSAHQGASGRDGYGSRGSFWDTATFTSPASAFASTPEYGKAMAHLLDSVASPSSTSPVETPPQSSSSLTGHRAAKFSSSPRHPQQQQQQQRQQQRQQEDQPLRRTPPYSKVSISQRERKRPGVLTAEAASTYASTTSVNDETSSHFSATSLTEACERHGSNWASPSEVLQLRSLVQDIASRYMREVQTLKGELAKARDECLAYARERKKVRELQQVYQDGVETCGKAKEREVQWAEERALLRLQMEKLMVENQRLQLYIAKNHRSHGHYIPARGGSGSSRQRERVQAGVQAVESAAAAAAAAAMSSGFTSLFSSWPPLPPTTTANIGSLAFPQSLGVPDSNILCTPLPNAAMATDVERTQAESTSPYTFLSSASSPLPQAQQDGGRGAAMTSRLSVSPPISENRALTDTILPSGATDASSPHVIPPQSSYASDPVRVAAPTSPGSDHRRHARPSAQHQGGDLRRPPRPCADHDEGQHMSSLITPSVFTSSSETTTSHSAAAAASGVTSSSEDDGLGPGKSARLHRQLRVGLSGEGDRGSDRTEEGDFYPSYARGVAEVSSTSTKTTLSSPAMAVRAMLGDDNLMRGKQAGFVGGQENHGCRRDVEGRGDVVTAASGAVGLPPSSSPAAFASARFPADAVTGSTTAVTLSTGSTPTVTTSSSWGLQYLYQLPRTPAEALQEEMRMLQEIRRLEEENRVLHARADYMEAMREIHANQCDQQQLQLTLEHDLSRRSAAQWELSSRKLESEVRQSKAQCVELERTLEGVLQHTKRQQELLQTRLVGLEGDCRAALVATRDQVMEKVGALRCSFQEFIASQATVAASASSAAAAQEIVQLRGEVEVLQSTIEGLRTELHELRAQHTALQDEHSTMQMEAGMRRKLLEGELTNSRELLAASCRDKECAQLRIDQLESEVERLRASADVSEGCMHAMEERLHMASSELTSQREERDALSIWQARAHAAEQEIGTQRDYYEREIEVYKTAASTIQNHHHKERMDLVKRYEKLQTRYEALRVRLSAAVSQSGAAALLKGRGSNAKIKRAGPAKDKDRSLSVNNADSLVHPLGSSSSPAVMGTEPSPSHSAFAVYDSLQALRTSGQATEKLFRSLHRTTSPFS